MSNLKPLLTVLLLLQFSTIIGQKITEYQWKNRLVILLTDSEDNETYKLQINDFQTVISGLEERKILVITLTPNYQITGIENEIKQNASLSYKDLKKETEGFEILLIGLDGYSKLRQSKLLTLQELFDLIDSMPMRRLEIEKN